MSSHVKPVRWVRHVNGEAHHFAVWFAWFVSGLAVLFGVLFLRLLVVNSADPQVDTYDYWLAGTIMAIVFPVVGALIVSRYPANLLGWVFCIMGFFSGAGDFASEYATYTLIVEPGALPGAIMAAWVSSYASDIGFLSIPLIALLFPDGRPSTPRWRPVVWLSAGAVAVAALSQALMPGTFTEYPWVANPLGQEGAAAPLQALLMVALFIVTISLFGGIASLILRYRSAQGIERHQLKWFTFAAALVPVSLLGNTVFPDLAWLIGGVSAAFIPLAIGIAILRYRLYDIDIIINRTLVYGALTACIVGLYVLVVGYLGALFQADGNVLVSLVAAGLVAVLFAPLRDRLQRGVNLLMYGERDDPYAVISRLGERLKTTTAPESVLSTIVATVAEALKLSYAAIALKQEGGEFQTVAVQGSPIGEPLVLPLSYGTEIIGQLTLSPRAPGEPFSPTDRRLIEDFARHAEAAAYAMFLTVDLRRSREQLVSTREEERRRLRRDLHDGLGPQLALLTLQLDATRNLMAREPAAADALLSELKTQVQAAITDIRRLVYDLRPPSLDELGLIPVIREQAANYSHNGLNVSVEAPESLPPLPAAVEVATYRIVQEALTNVFRHAGARVCRIRISVGHELELEIADDGVGLPEDRRTGVGLASMRERAAELGGTCVVERLGPAGGTHLVARLPLPAIGGHQ